MVADGVAQVSRFAALSVLVVDDDINIRSYMAASLKALGVGTIHLAETVVEAGETLDVHAIDGAFVDLVLQHGSGLDVGRMMARQGVPVAFCTGVVDEFNLTQMHEIGWVLPKPVRIAGLKRALETFVCNARRCLTSQCPERTA